MTRKTRKPITADDLVSEAQLEQTCTEWLQLDGWYALKTDPVSRREWGKGFGEKGMADRQYRRPTPRDPRLAWLPPSAVAELLWIEWKKLKGKAAAHQLEWIEAERSRGFLVLLAGVDFPATISGFQAFYRGSSLIRRRI
jgi:hypothetical protein